MSNTTTIASSLGLCAGDWVEVRSKEEILSTLDSRGQLEQMPFMPEMFVHCGKRFQVSKRAHKTCDPVNGLQSRRLPTSVHLDNLRCDGAAHGACQAGCLIFWKEAWLRRADGPALATAPSHSAPPSAAGAATSGKAGCSEADITTGTLAPGETPDKPDTTYCCQATQVSAATTPLPWYDPRQYVEDFASGNVSVWQTVCALTFFCYHNLASAGLGIGSTLRWLYDTYQKLIGGSPYPWRIGQVPKGVRTPVSRLDLQEGEYARVRTYAEILETLDEDWKNRGLYFDAEMVPYTEGVFKVLKRVDRIVDEKTGKMLRFKTDALILENVICQARYAKCRKLCPRAYYLYWREIWLERAAPDPSAPPKAC